VKCGALTARSAVTGSAVQFRDGKHIARHTVRGRYVLVGEDASETMETTLVDEKRVWYRDLAPWSKCSDTIDTGIYKS
jgi:hypothetical protein